MALTLLKYLDPNRVKFKYQFIIIDSRCSKIEFICGDGSCISYGLRCDGSQDCPFDKTDEEMCPSMQILNFTTIYQ